MATFSLGSGVSSGAPGVYINEQAGRAANANLADFSTVYMLVETDEQVSTTQFPYNTPTAITSLNDFKELIRVGNSTTPTNRIPLLSYNCVDEFFQNAQVGDLRVVRVGTPNQIVELEFLPSGTQISNTGTPSALVAGNTVYLQLVINGQKLVAGDGSTGYNSSGEWLGVPVTIPVTYVSGDSVNNRRISSAMVDAVVAAVQSNPAISTSVYIRNSGLVNDLNPTSGSDNGYVTLASSSFDGELSILTEINPVGSTSVFMNNSFEIDNIVGGSVNLTRVPQDYTQCISTAFDGQQDQGYLITPTAYAQFNAEGRALIGAAAANHCASNNFKWMALADPGPYFVTSINDYANYSAHKAAADLKTSQKYLIENAIYEWTGNNVSYDKLKYQSLVFGESAKTAINESSNLVASNSKVGLLDAASYSIVSAASSTNGVFSISNDAYWPVTLPIQKVSISNIATGSDFSNVSIQGGATGVNLGSGDVYVIAPAYETAVESGFSLNNVLLATNPIDASNIYNAVVLAGGSKNLTAPPTGAVFVPAPTSSSATVSYSTPYWDLPSTINGQNSDLIQNISGESAGVNTLHLPATLQSSTAQYTLNWVSRTFMDPSAQITASSGVTGVADGSALFACVNHGLRDGQRIFFTRPITATVSGSTSTIVASTTKSVSLPYWVKVVNDGSFVLSNSLANYSTNSFVALPTGITPASDISKAPAVFYGQVLGRGLADINSVELTTLPLIRARKYSFDSNTIWSQALDASVTPAGVVAGNPDVSVYLNNSSTILGEKQIAPYGEDLTSTTKCDWLPKLNLVAPTTSTSSAINNAFCVPTVEQAYQSEAFLVPSIDLVALGDYEGDVSGTKAPVLQMGFVANDPTGKAAGVYTNVAIPGGSGTGLTANITVSATGIITKIDVANGGQGYVAADVAVNLPLPDFNNANVQIAKLDLGTGGAETVTAISTDNATAAIASYTNIGVVSGVGDGGSGLTLDFNVIAGGGGNQVDAGSIVINAKGSGYLPGQVVSLPTIYGTVSITISDILVPGRIATVSGSYATALASYGIVADATNTLMVKRNAQLVGTYFNVTANGLTPDGVSPVVTGDRITVIEDGTGYKWVVVKADALGGDLTAYSLPCYGSQVELTYTSEQGVPSNLWRFDAITSTEIIDDALRGVGFNGVPQAKLIESGVDNVNRLLEDSQRYFNPFGFIAFYGSYIKNGAGAFIPPSPYVTGVAVRRYRAEGYQFPPAGVKYQLADAAGVQIPINSSQQNLLNPRGCNAVRTLPGYPQTSVFIWGGRTRVNADDSQQKLYQFVNTRVILNVVYGSLRNAFDSQIFNVIDGFGVIFNQIISVGNSVLNQLYVRGALFGARPSDAFQVICDSRINPPEDTENGIVNAKIFVTPVPALERIQIDLIRVAVGQMQNELDTQGLGQSNQ